MSDGLTPPEWATRQDDEAVLQHCCIDKKMENGKYRVQFKVGRATTIAFELTPFQLWLFVEALNAGNRE